MKKISLFRLGQICILKYDHPVRQPIRTGPVWVTVCGVSTGHRYGALTDKSVTCKVCLNSMEAVEMAIERQFET